MKLLKRLVLAAILIAAVAVTIPASAAPALPHEDERDTLIITTLLRFNDANLSGNYAVFRAMASQAFKDQLTEKDVADAFKVFRDQAISLDEVAIGELVPDEAGEAVHDNILQLSGYMDLSRFRMTYLLKFTHENNGWKLLFLNVNAKM
tara:strand:- start:418 stop:864 length:447 start_codon:yes stop_codon:yes gene_type:complete